MHKIMVVPNVQQNIIYHKPWILEALAWICIQINMYDWIPKFSVRMI